MEYTILSLMQNDGFACACGKRHFGQLSDCIIGEGALLRLPDILGKYGAVHPFILCDRETYAAEGAQVCEILSSVGVEYTLHTITRTRPAPDEKIVGEAVMFCPKKADAVIAVGGGVINDTGKILAATKGICDIYVATAPSMDGFASASSSMERAGLKVSLDSKCPDVVIGDAAVLAAAPRHMICSGIGDMMAKYVSLVEWRIAALLVGEYYCETVAEIVTSSLETVRACAKAAVCGDREAVCRLAEALVISGLAMNYAGLSRPASGMEHYISHIIDMRALAFGTPCELHGIQAGLGTLLTVRGYEWLAKQTPDRETARAFVEHFDLDAWFDTLRWHLDEGAEAMIAGEHKEKKYDPDKHEARLELILSHWDDILALAAELPSSDMLEAFYAEIGHPLSCTEYGLTAEEIRFAFTAAKDIRDKYVLGRLLWDLGLPDACAEQIAL
ncbi:MAG: iron-containing alcohol dehydrogenase [Clostridia bacterium]|nr:iron-containing alcohol dehydrogenase [Clostridia bacterium]